MSVMTSASKAIQYIQKSAGIILHAVLMHVNSCPTSHASATHQQGTVRRLAFRTFVIMAV